MVRRAQIIRVSRLYRGKNIGEIIFIIVFIITIIIIIITIVMKIMIIIIDIMIVNLTMINDHSYPHHPYHDRIILIIVVMTNGH